MKHAIRIAVAAVSVTLVSQATQAAQIIAGPISPVNGFPEWLMDHHGTAVTILKEGEPQFAGDPVDPNNPFSVQIGFGGEGFWYMAAAQINEGGLEVRLGLNQEAAFAGNGSAFDGNQNAFGRVRIDFRTAPAGNYRMTDPWGRTWNLFGYDDDDNSRMVDDNGDLTPYKNNARLLSLKLPPSVTYPGAGTTDPLHLLSANIPTFLGTVASDAGYLGTGLNSTLTNGGVFKLERFALNDTQLSTPLQTVQTNQFAVTAKTFSVPGVSIHPTTGDLTVANGLTALIVKPTGNTVTVTGGVYRARETYAQIVLDGGTISPGNSPGLDTFVGDMVANSNSGFDMEIEGFAGVGVNPGGHDGLFIQGNLTLNDPTLYILTNYPFTEADIGRPFPMFQYTGTLTGKFGNDDGGIIQSYFYTVDALGNVTSRTLAPYEFAVSYGSAFDKTITLTFSAIPEPSLVLMLAATSVALLSRRSRRGNEPSVQTA